MTLAALSLRDLEYLVSVAEHRHFGRAADACAVSQPTLSAQIQKLETLLRCAVFERTSRRVIVTTKGEEILRQARAVLAEAHSLLDLAHARQGPLGGPCRIGAIPTIGPYLFPQILRPLRTAYPALELVLSEAKTTDLVERLAAGALDVALLSPPFPGDSFAETPLFFEPFLLACPPALRPSTAKAALNALDPDRLMLLEEGHCLRDQALAICGRIRPGWLHATSLETLRHMIAAGAGYSLLPALALDDRPGLAGLIDYLDFDDPTVGRDVALVWRASDARGDQFRLLAETIRQHVRLPAAPSQA
jgi:LysR family transcriptional regulator, hydrogen peroxide-inducible genes activator